MHIQIVVFFFPYGNWGSIIKMRLLNNLQIWAFEKNVSYG